MRDEVWMGDEMWTKDEVAEFSNVRVFEYDCLF
jgi:hypothetical protein